MRGGGATCAVVFRTWGTPGPELMARAERWSASLSMLRDSDNCDLWISIDETREQVDRQKYVIVPSLQGSVSEQSFRPPMNATTEGGNGGDRKGDKNNAALSDGENAGATGERSNSGSQSKAGMSMSAAQQTQHAGDTSGDSLSDTLGAAATKVAAALGKSQSLHGMAEGNVGANPLMAEASRCRNTAG